MKDRHTNIKTNRQKTERRTNRWTDRLKDHQTEEKPYKQRVEGDDSGRIFVSLYAIINTKWGISFNWG